MNADKTTSKSIYSIRNAITALLYTLVNGLLSFLVTRGILVHYGSDFNGLNTTATQIINILLLFESGFAIASNVALFAPLAKHDVDAVSDIVSTTKRAFTTISRLFYGIGTVVIIGYSFLIKTDIDRIEVILVMLLALVPTGLNLLLATKYLVLFQSDQKEYKANIIKTLAYTLGYVCAYLFICSDGNRLIARAIMAVGPIATVVIITILGKRSYSEYSFKRKHNYSLIKGTKDLLVQKVCGIVYSTLPTLIISSTIGTKEASVYGVYNSVSILIKSAANAFITAPQMSLGVLIAEGDKKRVQKVFTIYEMLVLIITSTLFVTYLALIMPFVRVYTRGVTDIEYVNFGLAIVVGCTLFVQCVHIPSGILINMVGRFDIARKNQVAGTVALFICIILGAFKASIILVAFAMLIAALIIAIMEIRYTHFRYLEHKNGFIRNLIIYGAISLALGFLEYRLTAEIQGYVQLCAYGMAILIVNGCTLLCLCLITNRNSFFEIIGLIKTLAFKLLRKQTAK